MEDHQNISVKPLENNDGAQDKRADRRSLLKMGAAGLPMLMTLSSSAQGAVASQLNCFFRLPARVRIMVDENGNAWSSTTHNVRFNKRRQAWRKDDLDEFLLPGNSEAFTGGVPSMYVPAVCNTPPQGNWVYCGWNKYNIGNNQKITPKNYINNNDEFEFDGSNKGLYVALSIQYASQSTSGWPGVSCVISILNYLDTI